MEDTMRKSYKIEVDCPTCAQKLEDCANSTKGVDSCSVNLMTQKLTISSASRDPKEIVEEIAGRMQKIDDDVVIYC